MIVLYIILALLAVLLLNTWVQTAKARKLGKANFAFDPAYLEKCGEDLSQMVRCKTVSVKDSFAPEEFLKLRRVMAERFPRVDQAAEKHIFSDDCWMYCLKGKDTSRNILLMSHHDVVEADEPWTDHEPFSGDITDGKVWGRGTADTKAPLCAIFEAVESLLDEGGALPVNVWIGSSHNEELGGDGMPASLAYFQEHNITFEVILDEGGAIIDPPLPGMKCEKCAMIAVHEKGRCRLKFSASAVGAHGSLTGWKDNPVERMSAFIEEVTRKKPFITRFTPPVKEMFQRLAPYCGFPMNVLFCNLWLFGGIVKKVLPKINATAGGMVGTTCTFREIQGVTIEKYCTASAMLRNVSEEDLKTDVEAIKAIAEKYGITTQQEHYEYYKPADMSAPAYGYAISCVEKIYPGYPAAPYILPAGTDAWKLTPVCDCVLRFAPIRFSKQQLGSIHAIDENVDVSAVAEAAEYYKYFIANYR